MMKEKDCVCLCLRNLTIFGKDSLEENQNNLLMTIFNDTQSIAN
jgi:hypothetical protein